MPTYDYRCEKCLKEFSVAMSIAEHDRARVRCPACRSDRVTQQYSVFYAKTSKKS